MIHKWQNNRLSLKIYLYLFMLYFIFILFIYYLLVISCKCCLGINWLVYNMHLYYMKDKNKKIEGSIIFHNNNKLIHIFWTIKKYIGRSVLVLII